MKTHTIIFLFITSLLLFSNSQASESKAVSACEDKIRSIYGVDKFKHVEAEKTGNHKYEVHGKVKYQHSKHPFSCKVKKGKVRSYHYDGPTEVSHNKDDKHHSKSHTGRNVAIGVGIAAAIAMAVASNSKKNDDGDSNKNQYSRKTNKEDLEDSCHDAIDGRIKRNYHTIRRLEFKHDTIQHDGTHARGDGRVAYYNGEHTDFGFSCDFDHHGRVIDSSYSIY